MKDRHLAVLSVTAVVAPNQQLPGELAAQLRDELADDVQALLKKASAIVHDYENGQSASSGPPPEVVVIITAPPPPGG